MSAATYACPTCHENHEETPKADFSRPILPDRCSAQYRQENGSWRVCHADFEVFGGPNVIGRANLCDPCWNRQLRPHVEAGLRTLSQMLGGRKP